MQDRTDGAMAIAHEWISARAGSEKVFEALAATYPEADLYALTRTPGVDLETGGRPVRTTFLDRLGPVRDRRGLTLPLMPLAWRNAGDGRRYDTVVTSSHACVKGFRPARDARQHCYVHAPMRYVWSPDIDARGGHSMLAPARAALRRWDLGSVRWVDSFAANSRTVADRVGRYYDREAVVIPPPVDTGFFAAAPRPERKSGLVAVGRMIPYKGFDRAIAIAAELEQPLTIVGRGPDESRIRALAAASSAPVDVVTGASDEQLRAHVAAAAVLLFPTIEDFGIVPVESQAAGTPVVGPALGGLLDTVVDGVTGHLAPTNEHEDLVEATRRALSVELSGQACRDHAETFGTAHFERRVRTWVG